MPSTPTPFPVTTPVFVAPDIRLWQFTGPALQLWNTAGQWVVIIQVFFVMILVLAGLSLLIRSLRKFSNEQGSED